MRLSVSDLEDLPTLCQGQADDLKIEAMLRHPSGVCYAGRIWLARCGPEDGETQPIQIEIRDNGRWITDHGTGLFDGVWRIEDGAHCGDSVEQVTG